MIFKNRFKQHRRAGHFFAAFGTGVAFALPLTAAAIGPPLQLEPAQVRLWDQSQQFSNNNGWHSSPAYYKTIQYPNVDGVNDRDVCGRNKWGIVCELSNGETFDAETPWSFDFSGEGPTGGRPGYDWGSNPAYYETIQYPDINGDGMDDVCGRHSQGIFCAVSRGTNFRTGRIWTTAPTGIDFSDAEGWASEPFYWKTIQFADINDDGKDDVCGRHSKGIFCGLSDGESFGPVVQVVWDFSNVGGADFTHAGGWAPDPAYWSTIQLADVDGDGRADVCGRGYNGLRCALSRSTPDDPVFGPATLWDALFINPNTFATTSRAPFSDAEGWSEDAAYYSTIQFADLDGDGDADVCGRGAKGMECYLSYVAPQDGPDSGSFWHVAFWDDQLSGLFQDGMFSDANGWDQEAHYRTIRIVTDLQLPWSFEICGRGDKGIICRLVRGYQDSWYPYNPFPGVIPHEHLAPIAIIYQPRTIYANFGDNYGWGGHEYYWGTVEITERGNVCGRGGAGIYCGYGNVLRLYPD